MWSAARLVDAAAADVSNPFDDIVVAVVQLGLEHLQVANLQTGRSERHLRHKQSVQIISVSYSHIIQDA